MQPDTNQMAAAAYQNGQNLQNQYNSQIPGVQNTYNSATANANQAQQNLANYQKTMVDPSQMYSSDLTNAQNMYGFNPQDLLRANQNLAQTQTVMSNLPQAVQQQGAYYGTTAGSEANNYAQQSGNLNSVLQGQANTVGAYQNVLNATQQQANQQATLGYQGEQLNVQNLMAQASNYTQIMSQAGAVMNQIETLAQNQGTVTADQQQQYAQAYNAYSQANVANATMQQQITSMQADQGAYVNAQNAAAAASQRAGQPAASGAAPAQAPFNIPGIAVGSPLYKPVATALGAPSNQITGGLAGLGQAERGLVGMF